jgi:formyltetrahydrofolate deformylase
MKDVNVILLLSCSDLKGIVTKISNFIFSHNGNIMHADQYRSKRGRIFFIRIEWELKGFALSRGEIFVEFKNLASPFEMKWALHFTDYVPWMAVFVSRHLH